MIYWHMTTNQKGAFNTSTFQKVKRLLSPIKKFPYSAAGVLLYAVLVGLFFTALPYIFKVLTTAIETNNKELFILRTKILIGTLVIHVLLKVCFKPLLFIYERNVKNYLDKVYLKKFLQADNNDVERHGTGKLISTVGKGISNRNDMWSQLLRGYSIKIVSIISSVIILAQELSYIYLITITFWIFSYYRLDYFVTKALKKRKKVKEIDLEMDRMSVRRFMSKFEILTSGKYEYESEKRDLIYKDRWNIKRKEKVFQGLWYDWSVFFWWIVYIVRITRIIGQDVLVWHADFSDFVLITWLSLVVWHSFNDIMVQSRKLMDRFVHVEKLRDLFDNMKQIQELQNGNDFQYTSGNIELSKIVFWYNEDKIFKNFNLDIKWGTKTAFVWPSGSGKSTLIKLIAGYLSPQSGDIVIDNQKISQISLSSFYNSLWFLKQEPNVFDGTIYENLLYSIQENISDAQLHNILHLAKCEFIFDFKHGLQTEIGEKGIHLSWGQRQRLAIAKIFLKDPKIIILDEPTSALDSVSEEAVTEALHNLFKDRTVIIIAHRLQTVKEADEIILLDKWEIKERWNHEQLKELNGLYAKMLKLQSWF